MRLGAQPFLWKWVLFAWAWKMISISKAEHLPSFWNRGPGELGNGPLIASAHSRTRPALVTTTFSNFWGGRLLELRRYFTQADRHVPAFLNMQLAISSALSRPVSKVSSLNVTIIFFAGALASEEKIVQSTCHVSVVSPARCDYGITPRTVCEFVLRPYADVNSQNFCNSNNILLGWPLQIAYSIV